MTWTIEIPAELGYLANVEVVTDVLNPDDPELCPVCQHATLWRVQAIILHDGGVLKPDPGDVCGSDECASEYPEDPDEA